MVVCPVCGSRNITEKEKGQWYCWKCGKVTYVSPEADIPIGYDIEDYIPEED